MKPTITECIQWVVELYVRLPYDKDRPVIDAIYSTLRQVESAERELPGKPGVCNFPPADNPEYWTAKRIQILLDHIDALRAYAVAQKVREHGSA